MLALFENPVDWFILFLLVVLVLYLVSRITIVPKTTEAVVERLGVYRTNWPNGIHFLMPFTERIVMVENLEGKPVKYISLNEHLVNFAFRDTVSSDNVSATFFISVGLQIVDAKLYAYCSAAPKVLLERLTENALKAVVNQITWGQVLSDRLVIREKIHENLAKSLNAWGIRINRLDLGKMIPKETRIDNFFH
jgi:regulator of protease activity HflC (stomatin/prohibitin superfamily)